MQLQSFKHQAKKSNRMKKHNKIAENAGKIVNGTIRFSVQRKNYPFYVWRVIGVPKYMETLQPNTLYNYKYINIVLSLPFDTVSFN